MTGRSPTHIRQMHDGGARRAPRAPAHAMVGAGDSVDVGGSSAGLHMGKLCDQTMDFTLAIIRLRPLNISPCLMRTDTQNADQSLR